MQVHDNTRCRDLFCIACLLYYTAHVHYHLSLVQYCPCTLLPICDCLPFSTSGGFGGFGGLRLLCQGIERRDLVGAALMP